MNRKCPTRGGAGGRPEAARAPQAKAAVGPRGFTLIEVLVALAITAIALVAGIKATAALTQNAERQGRALLAQICAENNLIEVRLSRQLPGVGDVTTECVQGGVPLQVLQTVRPTPNPNFRRVDAAVLQDGQQILKISTIVGRN